MLNDASYVPLLHKGTMVVHCMLISTGFSVSSSVWNAFHWIPLPTKVTQVKFRLFKWFENFKHKDKRSFTFTCIFIVVRSHWTHFCHARYKADSEQWLWRPLFYYYLNRLVIICIPQMHPGLSRGIYYNFYFIFSGWQTNNTKIAVKMS